jgi:hypothetical protein
MVRTERRWQWRRSCIDGGRDPDCRRIDALMAVARMAGGAGDGAARGVDAGLRALRGGGTPAAFVTAEAPEQVRERARVVRFPGYRVTRADLRLLRAERERTADREVDMVGIDMSEARDGNQISLVALQQTRCLADVLRRGLSRRLPC